MEISDALQVIRSLADGVHPLTGETFPDNSPYQHPQVIRALFTAIRGLERDNGKLRPRRVLPSNAGKPWRAEEENQLCERFDAGMTVNQLAREHQRTSYAIRTRLEKQGKITSGMLK